MPSTTLAQLDDRHTDMAAAQSRKDLSQINFQVNPNDIGWMFWTPRMDKNMGRSKRVFWRLLNLKRRT